MNAYSTILNSNGAGRKSILEKWLEDHRFFMGIDKKDINIRINEDLTIDITTPFVSRFGWPDIIIRDMPPYGIRLMENFHKVTLINIDEKDIEKLPIFKSCDSIELDYCTLPQEYVSRKMVTNCCKLV